jgi:hypothetical protein
VGCVGLQKLIGGMRVLCSIPLRGHGLENALITKINKDTAPINDHTKNQAKLDHV